MRRWLSIAVLLACSSAWAKGTQQYLEIKDFHCGVDTYHSSLTLADCYVQDALNGYFDLDAPFVKRKGYVTTFSSSTYAYLGQWSYTDASTNIWLIVRSSDSIMATTGVGTSSFNIKIATVSATNVVNEVSALGNAYFVDQTQGIYYWNGTSTTYVASSPLGSLITEYHGRVWVAGAAAPNGNLLYGSKYLDGTTWATGGTLTTDPVRIPIALADNSDNTTCLFSGFNDSLYVFQNTKVNSLIGFDSTNFKVNQIGKEVGCINQGSIQQYLGGLVFASARGFEFFDGYTATRISDSIKNRVDPVTLNASFNQNSWTNSAATDWTAGTFNPTGNLSATISPPTLVLSTGTRTDTALADFSQATNSTNITFESTDIIISTNAAEITNNGFETGDFTGWTSASWGGPLASIPGSGGDCSITPQAGSYLSYGGDNLTADVIDASNSSVFGTASVTWVSNSCTWVQRSVTGLSNYVRRMAKLRLTGASFGVLTSDPFILNGSTLTFYTASNCGGATCAIHAMAVDTVGGTPRSSLTTANLTSRVFDTGFASVAATYSAGWTVNEFTPYVELQHSAASGGPFLQVLTSTGSNATANRYLRYVSSFSVTGNNDALSSLNDVTIQVTASSGTWTSASHNISTATAFGNLSITQTLNGGNILYSVCTANNSSMTGKACVPTNANSQISAATNIFAQVIATYTVTYATQTPTLSVATVNWYTGVRKPPMASMVYDNRYWISVATNTDATANDTTFVLSKGPIWTIFDIKAGAFTIWKNAPYFADAAATGRTYLLEQGYNDAGSAINAFVKTKDYAPGGIIADKFFDSLYLVADNLGSGAIYTNYFVDRSTAAFSLGNVAQNETAGTLITRVSIPLDSSHQLFGKTISVKIQQNDVDVPLKLYGGSLRWKARPAI